MQQYEFRTVWALCVSAIDHCLGWLKLFLVETGALPYFMAMFFIACGVWFLLDPIFGHGGSDRAGRRGINQNANDTKRLGDGR